MDPPPPPQAPPAIPLSAAAATATAAAATYPDSIDSSPRSRTTDSYLDDPQLLSSKLRLMCSFGGHIVPRPHDKSLCYIGGDTRLVVVDRQTTLSSLSTRLSNTLLNGRSFTLKYQLPSEDLDSLISVTTDEDLDNMIDEYDRTNNNSSKPSRLRLFIFPVKPDSSQSIGPILEGSAKSEDWFLNALNGTTPGLLNRGFSDSATVNCLLGLDDDGGLNVISNNIRDVDGLNKTVRQDVHSVPDSPMLETTSSFGSASSSPSLANLPPIRVHVEDNRGVVQEQKVVGFEEQFSQMSIVGGPPPPPSQIPVSIAVSGVPVGAPVVVGDYQNRVFSDDERSDHGVTVGQRKAPPTQTQTQTLPPQTQQKSSGGGSSGGAIDLPSPDSVSSDSSLSNAINRQKPVIYQESVVQFPSGTNRDLKINASDPSSRVQIQHHVQDTGYLMQPQLDQQQQQQQQQQQPQQYIHAGPHYIHHHPTGAVPMSAYYPVYPMQQQHHHQHHHQLEQQYPVYYVQTRQPQAYNLPVQQPNIAETTTILATRPQTPPNPAGVPPPSAYNPVKNAPVAKQEVTAAGMYRTTTTGTPQLVHVQPNQHQQQYVGYAQVHHPSQSVAPTSTGTANYSYELADPAHAQIYYTQPLAPTIPSQYQTMAAAAGVGLPEASAQLATENTKQQIRTSQPM